MFRKFCIVVLLFTAGCGSHGATSTLPTTTGKLAHRASVIAPIITVPAPTSGAMGHFQVFDERGSNIITKDDAQMHALRYGYVWGARATALDAWHTGNGNIYLGYYFGFPSDFDELSFGNLGHTVAWWKANHLSWIEYECDANGSPTVPAKIGGEGDVILDYANPDVLTYQVNTLSNYFFSLSTLGGNSYNAISLDTLDLTNAGNACGHYNTPATTFTNQYQNNPDAFKAMAVSWTQAFVAQMHSKNIGVVANNVPENKMYPNSDEAALLDAVDMVLDEAGPTATGNYRSDSEIVNMFKWMNYVQNTDGHGWLDVSNFDNDPSMNTTVTQKQSEFAAGMYLLGLDQTNRYAEVFIGLKSTYGLENWYPTLYNANFGTPCGSYDNPNAGSLFTRRYTNGFIAVDNNASLPEPVTLPALAPGLNWLDYATGNIVTSPATVQPHGALLLVPSVPGTTCT